MWSRGANAAAETKLRLVIHCLQLVKATKNALTTSQLGVVFSPTSSFHVHKVASNQYCEQCKVRLLSFKLDYSSVGFRSINIQTEAIAQTTAVTVLKHNH